MFQNTLQEYSALWFEVNITVSAYDELKMCKSRTEAVDPIELEDESVMESNLIISKYEVGIHKFVTISPSYTLICICIGRMVNILTCVILHIVSCTTCRRIYGKMHACVDTLKIISYENVLNFHA